MQEKKTPKIVPMEIDDSNTLPMEIQPGVYETKYDIPEYSLNDHFSFDGKTVKVVEVIIKDKYHVKNINEPYDSFIVTGEEVANQGKE